MNKSFYRKFFMITGIALMVLLGFILLVVVMTGQGHVQAQEMRQDAEETGSSHTDTAGQEYTGARQDEGKDTGYDGTGRTGGDAGSGTISGSLIPEGTVMIFSPIDPQKAVNVQDGSNEEGANIELMQQNNLDRQIFRIEQMSDGTYRIENAGSGLVLTVDKDNSAPEANVVQAADEGYDGQRWEILGDGDGLYVIRSLLGTYLDLYSGNAQDGSNIWMYSENDSLSQRWMIRKVSRYEDLEPGDEVILPDGIYQVAISLDYQRVMEVAGGAYEDGAGLCIDQDQDTPEQYFRFTREKDGYYSITAVHSGKALEIAGESTAPETDLVQMPVSEKAAQKWKLYYAGDNHCYICSELGTYIDLAGGDLTTGTKIWVYNLNGSHSQMWDLFLV